MSDPAPHRVGVLLLQLGTPASPATTDVRRYLREFLSDRRVLDMPAPARALLLNTVILPFRPRKSAEAYAKIWTEQGSPLIIHTRNLAEKVQDRLGDRYQVVMAMRYQQPPIAPAVEELIRGGCDRIVIFPLFPQYASASGGSAIAKTLEVIARQRNVPDLTTIGPFYDDAGFLGALATISGPFLESFRPDHTLFSYHGLPEQQIRKSDPSGGWCLAADACCDRITETNRFCYRAQCFATTRGLVARLGLEPGTYSTTFQSRLAGQKWIEPYTDKHLPELAARGVRRLTVLTPSFTSDCLETLEEIGIRGRLQWEGLGGEDFVLVPCLNAADAWTSTVADMVRKAT